MASRKKTGDLQESGKKTTCLIVSYEISHLTISLAACSLTYSADLPGVKEKKRETLLAK